MARPSRTRNIRVTPPGWLVAENAQARREVEYRRACGNLDRSIWDDVLERTDKALAKYEQPATMPEKPIEGDKYNG